MWISCQKGFKNYFELFNKIFSPSLSAVENRMQDWVDTVAKKKIQLGRDHIC